jgi:NRPS condensation-like uncharacterized protein
VAEKKATALRIPADLMVWAKAYAKSKNTSVTGLIIAHLTELRAQHDGNHVDQI